MQKIVAEKPFVPRKIDERTLEINGFQFPINTIGCVSSADDIVKCWQELQVEGFPMTHIAALFVGWESVVRPLDPIQRYAIPMPRHLIRLIDSIACCKSIACANKRINELKRKLCAHVAKAKATGLPEQRTLQSR